MQNASAIFERAPWLRQIILMVGLAASVAAGFAAVLWSREPDFAVLYAELATADAAEVAQALQRLGIDYRIEPATGQLQVPADRVHEARMQLAGEGLPRSADTGFAMLNTDPGLGVSEFMEGARYQHALENELARTIASLRPVQSARVHLVMPKQSAFLRDRNRTSASVVLNLHPGRSLHRDQVRAIAHLVAAGVPCLAVADVAIVDAAGNLLSDTARDEASGMPTREQFEYQRRYEESLRDKIESLLVPMLGPGGARASVAVELDFSRKEQLRESYDPERAVVRAEQSAEQRVLRNDAAGGVPGALSNTPPQAAESVPLSAAGDAAVAGEEGTTVSSQVNRNFEIDRTISHEVLPVGRVSRLSVAVLVDNLRTVDDKGQPVEAPLDEEQLASITQLIRDAIGFNAERGDSLNVMNARFQAVTPVSSAGVEETPFWMQPAMQSLGKQLLGVLVALAVLFGFVRPLLRSVMQPAPINVLPPVREEQDEPAPAALAAGPAGNSYEDRVGRARALIAQDPKRAAQVVKSWVGSDG